MFVCVLWCDRCFHEDIKSARGPFIIAGSQNSKKEKIVKILVTAIVCQNLWISLNVAVNLLLKLKNQKNFQ